MSESDRFEQALQRITQRYVQDGFYDDLEMNKRATSEMEELARKGLVLSLAGFAYDAQQTVAAIIELGKEGADEDALMEKHYLAARILGNWSLEQLGLANHGWKLFEMAEPLGLGLGRELEAWLRDRTVALDQASAWSSKFAPEIDGFIEYVTSRHGVAPSA